VKNPSYERLPLKWEDYFTDSEFSNPDVIYLQNVIRAGVSELPQGLFFSGPSGTGKTSLALLFIRSMRCLNKTPGDINPCGKCSHCTSIDVRLADRDPTLTGVFWLQPGSSSEESISQSVKHAFNQASRGPINTGNPDYDTLFIVFDEFKHFNRNLRVLSLLKTELRIPGINVCYIFITMDSNEIPKEERLAFARRTREINLRPVSARSIAQFIEHTYSFPPEVCKILAQSSEGRYGRAVSLASRCLDYNVPVNCDVASYVSQFPRDPWRWELWSLLKSQTSFKSILSTTNSILDVTNSPENLCSELIEDIINTINITNNITEQQKFALNLLTGCITNNGSSITSYIIQLAGLELVNQAAVFRNEEPAALDYIVN
jgi:DNA polymerase-3 subunit gamma/tau